MGDRAAAEARRTGSTAANEAQQIAGVAADGAKQIAQSAGEQAREVAQEAARQVSDLADQARVQLKFQAEQETNRAAASLHTLSEQARALSQGRVDGAGPLADQVGRLADQLADAAGRLERRGFEGLVDDVRSFAQRRPAAFIGLTALAGFAVTRIARSASSSSNNGRLHAAGGRRTDRPGALPPPDTLVAGRTPVRGLAADSPRSERADVIPEDETIEIEDIAPDPYENRSQRTDIGGS
jgi:hypothetical protein